MIGYSEQQNALNELREIEVNHKIINRVTKAGYLVLNKDENLSWKDQFLRENFVINGVSRRRECSKVIYRGMTQ